MEQLSRLGVHTFSLGLNGKAEWPGSVFRLFRFIKSHGIDLVHTSLFEADLLGGIAARLAGVPLITTLVNDPGSPVWLTDNPRLNGAKLALVKALKRVVLRTCPAQYVAISDYVRRSSIESLGILEGRTTVIHRAVPSEWMEPDPACLVDELRAELHLDGAYPVLLTVGRLVPQKGQKYLLRAMPQVLRDFPKATLLVVGDGFLRAELEELKDSLGLGQQVHFLGKRSDVKALLQVCDLFLFPSLFEGLGVALLEAAAMNRPCIASNVGPIPEIIENGHSGLLVGPCSDEAIARAIICLARRPHVAHIMGQRAGENVKRNFSMNGAVGQLEDLYELCLNKD